MRAQEPSPDAPSRTAGCLAIVAVAVPVSFGLALATDLIGAMPFVMIVTLAVATFIGGPLFEWLRRKRRHRAMLVATSGFTAGAGLPLLLGLLTFLSASSESGADDWAWYAETVIGFGTAGAVGSLLAWPLSLWLSLGQSRAHRLRSLLVIAATLVMVVGAFAVPRLTIDRSCHNPMRDGRTSIGPVASFRLALPQRDWPELDRLLHRFARERGWSAQVDRQPETGDMPWFQQSLCTEPGTQIMVMNNVPEPLGIEVSAYQPQGGDSWRQPMRALHAQLSAIWPHRIGYRDALGRPTALPPAWLAPRPAR